MSVTIIPAGMPSDSTKLMVQANNNSHPPMRMTMGINIWCRGPIVLAICGASRSIKDILPVTETAEAARATAVNSKATRSFSTETPIPIANQGRIA